MKNSLAKESINSWKQHSSQILNNFSLLYVVEWNMKEYSFRQFNKNLRRIITSGCKFHSYFQLKQSAERVSRDKCLMHKLLSKQIILHINSPCSPAPVVPHQLSPSSVCFIHHSFKRTRQAILYTSFLTIFLFSFSLSVSDYIGEFSLEMSKKLRRRNE